MNGKNNLKDGMFKSREAWGKEENSICLPSAKQNAQLRVLLTWSVHTWVSWLWPPQSIAVWCLKLLDYCNYIHQHKSALAE